VAGGGRGGGEARGGGEVGGVLQFICHMGQNCVGGDVVGSHY